MCKSGVSDTEEKGGVPPATCAESSQRAVRSALGPVAVSMASTLSAVQSPRLSPLLPGTCRTEGAINRLQSNGFAARLDHPCSALSGQTAQRRRDTPAGKARYCTRKGLTPVQALGSTA